MQLLGVVVAIRASEMLRRVACCAAAAPSADSHRLFLSEAAQRVRESSGLASQTPQVGQAAVGQLVGLKGTLRTRRPIGSFARPDLL